jgi:hypothetical protein
MRPQQCGRHPRGNLDGAPPGEIWGLWIAQPSNRWLNKGSVAETCTAIGVKPWFVPDEVRLYIPDVLEHRRGESDSSVAVVSQGAENGTEGVAVHIAVAYD